MISENFDRQSKKKKKVSEFSRKTQLWFLGYTFRIAVTSKGLIEFHLTDFWIVELQYILMGNN